LVCVTATHSEIMLFRTSLALVGGVAAQSFVSCNTDDAHFKDFKITSSPDPPVLGKDVTFTIEGAADKAMTGGSVTVSIKAGPINFPLSVPFTNNAPSGKFVAGQKVTASLGPFTYPNIKVPLIKNAKGKIEIMDQDGEQFSCATFTLPAYSATAPESTLGGAPFVDCSTDEAHFKNRYLDVEPPTIKKGTAFTVHGKGDLDEDVAEGNLDLQINLSLFSFGISSPFKISSPLKAAHADVTVGPIKLPSIPLIPNAKGSIKLSDKAAEELICYNFNLPIADAVSV